MNESKLKKYSQLYLQHHHAKHQRFRITFLIRLIANISLIRCQQDRLKDISRVWFLDHRM